MHSISFIFCPTACETCKHTKHYFCVTSLTLLQVETLQLTQPLYTIALEKIMDVFPFTKF